MPEHKERKKKSAAKEKNAEKEKTGQTELIIDPAIVVDIVRREALNTAGVVEIADGSFIGRGKGVTVTEVPGTEKKPDSPDSNGPGDGGIAYKIELHLFVEYGTNCQKLAEVLARRISRTVKQMTHRDVLEVLAHVEGIRDPVPGDAEDDTDRSTLDF